MRIRFLLASAMMTSVFAFASAPAFAGGGADSMPGVSQEVSPLDDALNDTHSTVNEAPIPFTPEEVVEPQLLPPAPMNREVIAQPNSSYLGLSLGVYDAFTHSERNAALGIEFQPGFKIAGFLQPIFGGFVTPQKTWMGYGGLGVPFKVTDRVTIMPSLAAGYYKEGDGYDLDRSLAFRGGAEISYEFDNASRLGLAAHVITNGTSADRSDRTEVISLKYSMPLERLFPSSAGNRAAQTNASPSLVSDLNKK